MKKNVSASVRARLTSLAKSTHRPFNEILVYYGIERFLYRLGKSKFKEKFILKGALMIRAGSSDDPISIYFNWSIFSIFSSRALISEFSFST